MRHLIKLISNVELQSRYLSDKLFPVSLLFLGLWFMMMVVGSAFVGIQSLISLLLFWNFETAYIIEKIISLALSPYVYYMCLNLGNKCFEQFKIHYNKQ